MKTHLFLFTLFLVLCIGCNETAKWEPLFPNDGKLPAGWFAGNWDDVSKPPPEGTDWQVKDGVLTNEGVRDSWLISEKNYCNFELEFEFKLGERGNSGCALRVPPKGDPAFDGVEIQMADVRYNPEATDAELTGGIYRAIAPTQQVYKPLEWNKYHIVCEGPRIKVTLNGVLIQDVNLKEHEYTVLRHSGEEAVPLNKRPICGRIGFQELSYESKAQIRNARIKELK